jgi:hypothetical protein
VAGLTDEEEANTDFHKQRVRAQTSHGDGHACVTLSGRGLRLLKTLAHRGRLPKDEKSYRNGTGCGENTERPTDNLLWSPQLAVLSDSLQHNIHMHIRPHSREEVKG